MSANWMLWYYVANFLPGAVGLYAVPFEIWPCVFLNLLVLATGSVAGLACVWAGLGRPHWFWRIAVLLVVASLALLVSAHELLISFFIQAVVTIPPLLVVRYYKARHTSTDRVAPGEDSATPRRRLQWSLGDQLLACVLLSGMIAAAVQIPSEVWESWVSLVLLGLMFGLCTLLGTWAAFSKRRLRWRLAAICLLPPSAIIACWLGIFKTYRKYGRNAPSRPWPSRLVRVGLPVYSLLLLTPPTAVFCLLIQPVPIPALRELPDPNGFDDLVRAGEAAASARTALSNTGKMSPKIWGDPSTGTDVELRELTSATAEALRLARLGLDGRCRAPFSYSNPITLDHVTPLRALGRAFWAEGELAEREGRKADAARSYEDMIRVGYGISRGGDMTDFFVGTHVLTLGAARLHDIRSGLESTHCAELAKKIHELESAAEPWSGLRDRNAAYNSIWGGWQLRVTMWISDHERYIRDGFRSVHAKSWLVICSLALQAHYLDHGAWPDSLADLTPEYLPDVPEDPFTGQPIVYHCDGPGYWLYCLPPETADWDTERRSTFNFSYDGSDE